MAAVQDVQLDELIQGSLQSLSTVASFYATGGLSVVGDVLQGVAIAEHDRTLLQAAQYADLAATAITADYSSLQNLGETNMGLFDDLSWDSVTDFASSLVDEVDWGSVGNFAMDAYSTFAPQQSGGTIQPYPMPVSAGSVPRSVITGAAGAIARVGPTVGRKFFDKFPNLAVAIQKMRNAGQNITRSKLYSMVKRFGPEFMVSAGILSAAAVSELLLAGPGHRRMNPANSKALRRATRRIKSFHRLCGEADVIKTRRRSFPRSCAKRC